jgi:hypothetical protein
MLALALALSLNTVQNIDYAALHAGEVTSAAFDYSARQSNGEFILSLTPSAR